MEVIIGSQKEVLDTAKNNQEKFKEAIFIRITSDKFEDLPFDTDKEYLFDFPDIEEEDYKRNLPRLKKHKKSLEEILDKKIRINPITDEEAKEIRNIAKRIKEEKIDILVVHCDEGKCRSPSVAYCILKLLDKEDLAENIKNNPRFRLSETIIKKVLKN